MCNYRQLTEQVQNRVQSLYQTANCLQLVYHNLTHTEHVVVAATQIAHHYGLNNKDFFTVIAAAWFHDVGYLTEPAGHEARSAGEAVDFLASLLVDDVVSDAVSQCILSTKMPQQPHSLCEQILCDADLFHLGTHEFWKNNELLRKEHEALYHTSLSKEEWRVKTINLMQAHHYHTHYCRQLLGAKKEENIAGLLAKQKSGSPAKSSHQPEQNTTATGSETN